MSARALARLALAACLCACAGKAERPREDPEASGAATSERGGELGSLCAHSYELLIEARGIGSDAVRAEFIANCVANSELRRAELGEAAWAQRSACIHAAEDSVALGRCDGREPPAPSERVAPSVAPSQVCARIIELMVAELGAALVEESMGDFRQQCAIELERAQLEDPADYERSVRCVMQAADFEAMSQCSD